MSSNPYTLFCSIRITNSGSRRVLALFHPCLELDLQKSLPLQFTKIRGLLEWMQIEKFKFEAISVHFLPMTGTIANLVSSLVVRT
jgi:hypothetical protein